MVELVKSCKVVSINEKVSGFGALQHRQRIALVTNSTAALIHIIFTVHLSIA